MRMRIAVVSVVILSTVLVIRAKTEAKGYDFKARTEALYDAWGSLDPNKAARFYAKDADLVFFDIAPMKYSSWAEYAAGVPQQFAPFASGKFKLNDDFKAHQIGNSAWATATWHGDLIKKDGSKVSLDGRYSCVWEKRRNEWLLVQEHMSVPLAPPQ